MTSRGYGTPGFRRDARDWRRHGDLDAADDRRGAARRRDVRRGGGRSRRERSGDGRRVASGVGAIGEAGLFGFLKVALAGLVAWWVWAFLTWFVGTKLLPAAETRADMGELLRTIGFSSSPGILRVLSGVPLLGPIVGLVASFWMLAAMVVAVRQALDYKGTGRAVAVCLLGFLVYIGILVGTAIFFGLGAFMLGSILAR